MVEWSTKTVICLCLLIASTSFIMGAFYQHDHALNQLQQLIQTDPYAFHIRHKLYDVLQLFPSTNDPDCLKRKEGTTRMQEIMKYGFPGMDDLRLYTDFVLSYDRRNRVAHWVYEHLRAECVRSGGSVTRNSVQYQADMRVPSNFRADPTDYRQSGFDRGHLAAAANHRCLQLHCDETFYLTNIAPQVGKGFNRDAWNNLEIYVRELTERYGSVYVCTGPLYIPKRQDSGKWYVEFEVIGRNTIAVPTHFFKVILIESKLPQGMPYMEAYVMPNAPISDNTNLRSFLCDISTIERTAGLQFFNGLRRGFFFATNYATTPEIYQNFQ